MQAARRASAEFARGCARVPGVDPMTDETPAAHLNDDELNSLRKRRWTELSADELTDMKATLAARGIRIYNSTSIEQLILAYLAGNIGTPFLQTLSQRAANSVVDMSKQVTNAVRKHVKRKDTPRIELPDNMTDEAWLALFEIVNAGELRGRVLRWDEEAMAWRPGSSTTKRPALLRALLDTAALPGLGSGHRFAVKLSAIEVKPVAVAHAPPGSNDRGNVGPVKLARLGSGEDDGQRGTERGHRRVEPGQRSAVDRRWCPSIGHARHVWHIGLHRVLAAAEPLRHCLYRVR
jgi:hypothetical protein